MEWRNAKSLDALKSEVQVKAPGTTVWTLGDAAHQASWSDHNPNAAGVVCAADILDDAGLDLRWLADTVVATNPPALKYVIYQDRIWFPGYGWSAYTGQYHTHVHVSVGWGPDGQSTGPYDDLSPWLGIEEDMDEEVKMWIHNAVAIATGLANGVDSVECRYAWTGEGHTIGDTFTQSLTPFWSRLAATSVAAHRHTTSGPIA